MAFFSKNIRSAGTTPIGVTHGRGEQAVLFIFLSLAAFIVLEIVLFKYVDLPVALYMKDLDQTRHGLIDFFRTITDLGKSDWYLWPCGILTLFAAFLARGKDVPHRYRALFGYIGVRAVFLFATVGISGIFANILKTIFGRARPILWFQNNVYGFDIFKAFDFAWNSMPSGHTATAFALALSFATLYPRARFLCIFYALVLAASRILVGAHYLSDVAAGALLGSVSVWVVQKYGMSHLSKVIFPIDKASAL